VFLKEKRPPTRLLGAVLLLLLLALLLPLGGFLAGLLPGGRARASADPAPGARREPGTLEVTVLRASDRTPVAGARIVVERLTGGEAQAESDAEGRVRVKGLGSGPVRVRTTVEGREAETWADPGVRPDVLLAVGAEPTRAGRVLRTGGAAARARVSLLAEDGRELASTETDERGAYELPDLPDAAAVCAVAEGCAPAIAPGGELVLREGSLVEGRIAGAAGGKLSVHGRVAAPRSDEMLVFRAEWDVGPDGTFRGRLPAGAEAFGLYGGLPVRVAAGTIDLPKAARVSGTVRRADGLPAARAALLFRPLVDADFATPLPGLRVDADANGQFQASGFADVRYSVEAYAPDCATRVIPEVRPGDPLEITLEKGVAIGGFVVDTTGLPVPGARVRAVGLPEGEGRPVLSAVADPQGRFRIAGLGGARQRVRITAPGYHPTTLDLRAPTSDLRVVLQVNG
jgi:hypothetical protein